MVDPLHLPIQPQPDDSTCGPTCLHAVYRHLGIDLPLEQVIGEVPTLATGGTLGVLLGSHALERGLRALMYTYNLRVLDPTWFAELAPELRERLAAQAEHTTSKRLEEASHAYLRFLDHGGELELEDLTPGLLRRHLKRGELILTGLSATYLYRTAREVVDEHDEMHYDDVRGVAQGHFVVLCAYDSESRTVLVADPLQPNPVAESPHYWVDIDRLVCAILLGVLTYDANLLVLRPPKARRDPDARPDRRRSS